MPTIGGRNFPYTSEGMRAANLYQQQLAQNPGMRGGGLPGYMGFRPLGMQRGGALQQDAPTPEVRGNLGRIEPTENIFAYERFIANLNSLPIELRGTNTISFEDWNAMTLLRRKNISDQVAQMADAQNQRRVREAREERTGNLGRILSPETRSVPADAEGLPSDIQSLVQPAGLRNGGMLPRRRRY